MAAPTNLNAKTGIQKFSLISLITLFICERDDWDTKAELIDMTTTPVWKGLGETKQGEETALVTSSTTVPILTVEGGSTPHGEMISDMSCKLNFTLAQVDEVVKQYLTNYYTANGIENAIGQMSKVFSLRIHPAENGADYTKDWIIPKCSIKVDDKKTSKQGEYETLVCEATAIFDNELEAGESILMLTKLV